ncbi:flagellar basal body-associated FliL family protein [Agaribacterium haliotis]|uniref:flagellar basal body-associated FliL family protein n=1 Tax=Agaribacterium haliotis TaxID=2013869 RepID=UPI001EFEAF99|nr:flagellar basal body-associated FliL family protein [Agaribacterium haliotis]
MALMAIKLRYLVPGLFLLLFIPLLSAHAEEETEEAEGESAAAAAPIYIPLKPAFVVNYGGAGRLKYLKTEVTIRLSNPEAANAVRHHMPFIRNNLVMVFAAQTDETLESQDGREAMRMSALAEIRDLLQREDGVDPEYVVDVLFNRLTWH